MNLWQNYKKVLFNTFAFEEDALSMQWEGKRNTSLAAKTYRHKYFLKARILVQIQVLVQMLLLIKMF